MDDLWGKIIIIVIIIIRLNNNRESERLFLSEPLDCKILELFELEGILHNHLVQLPCNDQGCPQLEQVAQILVQPSLVCHQGWDTRHLSGQIILSCSVNSATYIENLIFLQAMWIAIIKLLLWDKSTHEDNYCSSTTAG